MNMKLKALGLAAVAAMAFTAFAASSASATTLEIGGVKQNGAVFIEASLSSGWSTAWARTDGVHLNTCTSSTVVAHTVTVTGSSVTAAMGLGFGNCQRPVTVHNPGILHISHQFGTDGTVSSSGAEVTVGAPPPFGTLNCKTGGGVDIGTLTGTDGTPSGHAELHINAVLNCGITAPSVSWKGTYVVTSPTGLGVVA